MSSPLDDLILEEPGKDPDVTPEESSTSDLPEDSGASPEAEGEKPQHSTPEDRTREYERKLKETEDRLMDLVAENSSLKTRLKAGDVSDGKPVTKEWTVAELKAFADQDDGKHAFDASVHLTEQTARKLREEILGAIDQKLDGRTEDQIVKETIEDVLPGALTEGTDTHRKVRNEQLKLMKRGLKDENKAFEAALFRVAAKETASREPEKNPEEYASERAVQDARGTGAPKGKGGAAPQKMTQEQLETARAMGLKRVFSKDPKVRDEARAMFLKRVQNYDERRIA